MGGGGGRLGGMRKDGVIDLKRMRENGTMSGQGVNEANMW